jgi:hypothetical protein
LVHAPEQIPALVADARPGAAWRFALGIAEPTEQLGAAIESLDRLLQATGPTLDVVLAATAEDRQASTRSTSWFAPCCDRPLSNSCRAKP